MPNPKSLPATATSRLVESSPRRVTGGVTWADQSPTGQIHSLEQVLFVEARPTTPSSWLRRRFAALCVEQHRGGVASSRRWTVLMVALIGGVAVLLLGLVAYVFVRRIGMDDP